MATTHPLLAINFHILEGIEPASWTQAVKHNYYTLLKPTVAFFILRCQVIYATFKSEPNVVVEDSSCATQKLGILVCTIYSPVKYVAHISPEYTIPSKLYISKTYQKLVSDKPVYSPYGWQQTLKCSTHVCLWKSTLSMNKHDVLCVWDR